MCDAFLGGASLFYDFAFVGSATDFSDRSIKVQHNKKMLT